MILVQSAVEGLPIETDGPDSDVLDAIVQMIYLLFVLAAAVDSTWGMVLCAEWGVRAPAVPRTAPAHYLERRLEVPDDPERRARRQPGTRQAETCASRRQAPESWR